MPSQRIGAKLLAREEQIIVQRKFQLLPVEAPSGQTGVQAPGRNRAKWADAGNEEMKEKFAQALMAGLHEAVQHKYDGLKWKLEAKALSMASLEGAGHAAEKVVYKAFGAWVEQAVLTPDEAQKRRAFAFTTSGAQPTLIDSTNSAARANGDQPVSARDLAAFLVFNDEKVRQLMADHDFQPGPAGTEEEEKFLSERIIAQFTEADNKLLSESDRLGYSSTRPGLGKVFISPVVQGWDGVDETAQPAMQRKYEVFQTLVHEYLHMLEHPLIPQATRQSLPVREGVCEWLTCQVINNLAAGGDEDLKDVVRTVEGERVLGDVPGRVGALRAFLAQYRPKPDYAGYVAAVRDVACLCGENGVKAAFFQGHVEFFGLWDDGKWRPGITVTRWVVNPVTEDRLNSVTKLSAATGLPEDEILRHNPDLVKDIDQWPQQLLLPGYHGHRPIYAGDDAETWQQIAAQHNVSVERLKRANGIPDGEVVPGSWLLVPDQED